jgi:hypothetical protein
VLPGHPARGIPTLARDGPTRDPGRLGDRHARLAGAFIVGPRKDRILAATTRQGDRRDHRP